jgi:hypothetical protein
MPNRVLIVDTGKPLADEIELDVATGEPPEDVVTLDVVRGVVFGAGQFDPSPTTHRYAGNSPRTVMKTRNPIAKANAIFDVLFTAIMTNEPNDENYSQA